MSILQSPHLDQASPELIDRRIRTAYFFSPIPRTRSTSLFLFIFASRRALYPWIELNCIVSHLFVGWKGSYAGLVLCSSFSSDTARYDTILFCPPFLHFSAVYLYLTGVSVSRWLVGLYPFVFAVVTVLVRWCWCWDLHGWRAVVGFGVLLSLAGSGW